MNEYATIAKRMAEEIRKMYEARDEGNYGIKERHKTRLFGMESILDIMGIEYNYIEGYIDDLPEIVMVDVMGYETEV